MPGRNIYFSQIIAISAQSSDCVPPAIVCAIDFHLSLQI